MGMREEERKAVLRDTFRPVQRGEVTANTSQRQIKTQCEIGSAHSKAWFPSSCTLPAPGLPV